MKLSGSFVIWAALLFAGTAGSHAQDATFFETASCVDCHDADMKKGGLDLTTLKFQPADPANAALWEKLHDRVERGEMPPPDKSQPEPALRAAFLKSLAAPLHEWYAKRQAEQGRTGLRRLNRTEYENTVHELLGISTPLTDVLPEDGSVQGFDTVGEGLRFSPLLMGQYLEAADVALDAALSPDPPPVSEMRRVRLTDEEGIRENLETPQGKPNPDNPEDKHQVLFRKEGDGVIFFADTYQLMLKGTRIGQTGDYTIRVSGNGFQSRGEPVTLIIMADNYQRRRVLGSFELPPDQPRVVSLTLPLNDGEHLRLEPAGTNFNDEGKGNWGTDAAVYDGVGMAIQWVEIEGPLGESWPPRRIQLTAGDVPCRVYPEKERPWRNGRHEAFVFEPPDAIAALTAQIPAVAARAYRRPLQPGETEPPLRLALAALADGASFTEALRTGIKAILTAPQFLLFEERPGELDCYALASRLSYFLWSAPPDGELLTLAGTGALTNSGTLRTQTQRLLADAKSAEFVKNFTGQWLGLRGIDATSPDMTLYPEFDDVLKRSMVGETEAFFTEMIRANRPVTDFIQSDWLMLNRRLSQHYGIPGARTEAYERVSVPPGSPRGGLLTQAAILKVTANGTTTSPVVRGTWVLKRLLNQPPFPPPPVPAIEPDTRGATTVRELLAKHRSSASCNSCHRNIDPPGFALESFDVIGGWRERYRSNGEGDRVPGKLRGNSIWQYKLGPPVDSTGQLPDGRAFSDIASYKQLLLTESDTVIRAIATKLLVYGSGGAADFADRQAAAEIAEKTKAAGGGFRSLIEEVVQAQAFRRK